MGINGDWHQKWRASIVTGIKSASSASKVTGIKRDWHQKCFMGMNSDRHQCDRHQCVRHQSAGINSRWFVSNQCSVSFGSIITKVRKRHLALFKQNLYEKYTQKFQNCNFLEKPCINILVTYHFGKLITCPIHWYIQNPAHSKIKYYFPWPEPCSPW